MGFKLKGAPYNKDDMNIGVYRRDLKDGSAGKSNHTGIIIDKDVSPEMEKAVIAHETVHQHQQRNGELDYDKENFYWKGKTYPRENLNEHNEELPWEKDAYKASDGVLNNNVDMKNKFKLGGYRGNNKAFKSLSDRGLIGPPMEYTVSGGDGDNPKNQKTEIDGIVKKRKEKVKRFGPNKGTRIIKESYKNLETGEKGGKKTTIKPTTFNYNQSIDANLFQGFSGGGGGKVTPKIKITPGSDDEQPGGGTPPRTQPTPPENKPADPKVKPPTPPWPDDDDDGGKEVPVAKKGQKQFTGTPSEWMEKMSLNYPGKSGKELAEKGHIHEGRIDEYDKTYYKPKKEEILPMARITAKPIANIDLKTTAGALQIPKASMEVDGGIKVEPWHKKKGKKKTKPPSDPPLPPLEPTESSVACTKGKKCLPKSPFSNDNSGMFGEPTRRDIRAINKDLRKLNKANRQDYRADKRNEKSYLREEARDARKGGYDSMRKRERVANRINKKNKRNSKNYKPTKIKNRRDWSRT